MTEKNFYKKIAMLLLSAALIVTAIPNAAFTSNAASTDEAYKYVYAGLTWVEYWASQLPPPTANALEVGACNCPVV